MGSQTNTIKQEARDSNEFQCATCPHKGAGFTWPPFEANFLKTYDKLSEEEKLVEDTYCFHTRLNVGSKAATLGTGVAFARQIRTTDVNKIYTTIDLVSQKAYKEGLRKSVNKKKFTHWLPLYFK